MERLCGARAAGEMLSTTCFVEHEFTTQIFDVF